MPQEVHDFHKLVLLDLIPTRDYLSGRVIARLEQHVAVFLGNQSKCINKLNDRKYECINTFFSTDVSSIEKIQNIMD